MNECCIHTIPHHIIIIWIMELDQEMREQVGQGDKTWLSVSVQFSRLVMSDSLQPQGLQHDRLPHPSLTPRACSDSCPQSWWCHPFISSSVVPTSCLQSFPASGSFPISQLFASGDQNIGVSAPACLSSKYSGQISFRIDWFDLLAV